MVWERARAAKEKFEAALLGKKHVVGVGVAKKKVGGKETDEPCVVVFVDRKVPNSQLKKRDRVPTTVGGVKTDVIETGEIRALGLSAREVIARTGRIRPAPGGVSVGHVRVTAGTLGGVVRHDAGRLILSNNHVLANSNEASVGDAILQPGPADGGGFADRIAALERFIPIDYDRPPSRWERIRAIVLRLIGVRRPSESHWAGNRVDAAVARPLREEDIADEILEIGRASGISEVSVGSRIRKSGRSTGLTDGTIVAVAATVRVSYGARHATFRDQLVAGPMSRSGDSGSLAVDDGNHAVGLLFAGSDRTTVFNPIAAVVDALGIDI